jgi:ABC-type glycerol-3-phosphate transport system substrate-binding protein
MKRFLTILMPLFIVVLFYACAETSGGEAGTSTAAETTAAADTAEPAIELKLPEKNYEGYEFKIMTKGETDVHWKSKEIFSEEITGDALKDAVYERNMWLSEKYGVRIIDIGAADPYTTGSKSILAGADDYDMFCVHISYHTASFVSNKMLVDLYDVPHIDLSQPYYDQNSVKSLSVVNKLFCVTGDMLTMDNDATWVVLFNKTLADEYKFESKYGGSFYDLVNDRKWTHDMLFETARAAASDLNGDGVMDETDQWGLESEGFNAYALLVGSGITSFSKNADDYPYISLYSETAYEILDKAIRVMRDNTVTMYVSDWTSKFTDVWTDCMDKTFSDGRSLYNFAGLNRVTLFRSMNTDFGILPIPKYTEEQDKYCCAVSLWGSNCIAVPKTATDLDRTGLVIEAVSWKSKYTLTPAYYDITLKGKASRDEESLEMLDLIFASTSFDLGNMFDWGGMYSVPAALCESKSAENFASRVSSLEQAAISDLNKFIDKITGE